MLSLYKVIKVYVNANLSVTEKPLLFKVQVNCFKIIRFCSGKNMHQILKKKNSHYKLPTMEYLPLQDWPVVEEGQGLH